MNSIFKWLYPGLKIKRWLLVVLLGNLLISYGIILLINGHSRLSNLVVTSLALLLILVGLITLLFGIKSTFISICNIIIPESNGKTLDIFLQKRQLKKGPKIVVLGGGTGLSVLLRGLKKYTSNITAIVTVTDDGGSSGRLRCDFGILPPGDIRNCLLALSEQEGLMKQVLDYRFQNGAELKGHNLGNLLIATLNDVTGDMCSAIQELSRVLAISGDVLPATLEPVILGAKMADGSTVLGETAIVEHKAKIEKVFLEPKGCKPLDTSLKAIREADAIILGPGSLYTSILPNLLVDEVRRSIIKSKAPVFYVCNVMSQPGETDNYTAEDHLDALYEHVNENFIDYIIVNTQKIPEKILNKYKLEGAEPVLFDEQKLKRKNLKIIKADLLGKTNYARHDSEKLAQIIIKEIFKLKPQVERLKFLDLLFLKYLKNNAG